MGAETMECPMENVRHNEKMDVPEQWGRLVLFLGLQLVRFVIFVSEVRKPQESSSC